MAASKAKPEASQKRERTDKAAVERDYRLGRFTLRELGSKYGCNHSLIAKWVKQGGWTQDLTAAVKAATNAKLMQEAVTTAVTSGEQAVTNAVLAVAEANARIILSHRKRLESLAEEADKAQAIVMTLSSSVADVREAAVLVGALEGLSRISKNLIDKQRENHRIDEPASKEEVARDLSDAELQARIEELNARRG